jgi:cytochrome oxidase Cu insertion factor (SCO1/SenC/PrrC family)
VSRAGAPLALLGALLSVAAFAHEPADVKPTAPGPGPLFEPPAAGSYELPVIQRVSDRELVDADGERGALLGLDPGECALVAFVYLSCTDAQGCPLSLASIQRVDREIARREDLRERVRLVTVSFDPERDGPEQMANLRKHMKPRADWRFFTAGSRAELRPVLEDFGQDAVPLVTADGRETGQMRHVLKIFLVDAAGGVRNVYSTGFLDPRLLVRDLETLLLVEPAAGAGSG